MFGQMFIIVSPRTSTVPVY